MAHSDIQGVVVITRNGDRLEFHQDPQTYKAGKTQTTPLGAVQSFNLGAFLRQTYLEKGASSYIKGISSDLIDTNEFHMRVKAGGEEVPTFDNGIALLQGLYPPTQKNAIKLANGTTVVAPLGGYQYIPVETVEPSNDRSLEPWTDCPNFAKHVAKVHSSDEFKKKAEDAGPFLRRISDFVWGPTVNFENMWNVYDYVHAELTHNKSYAYRLPPSLIDTSRALVNWQQDRIFSDPSPNGIGNIAGRTILRSLIGSLQRISYDGDPLQMLLQETTYQPFISLFHMLELKDEKGDIRGVPNFASALAFELRRGPEADSREYLRIKFKNGTADGDFRTIHALGHKEDIPITEFIFRSKSWQISNNGEWRRACTSSFAAQIAEASTGSVQVASGAVFALLFFLGLFLFTRVRKARRGQVRLAGPESLEVKA